MCVREATLLIVHHKEVFTLRRPHETPPWQRLPFKEHISRRPSITCKRETTIGINAEVDYITGEALRLPEQPEANRVLQTRSLGP